MYTSKIQEIQEQARRLPEGGRIGHAAAGALHSPFGKCADQLKVEAKPARLVRLRCPLHILEAGGYPWLQCRCAH